MTMDQVSGAEVVPAITGVTWNRTLSADEMRRVHENFDLFVGIIHSVSVSGTEVPETEIVVTPAMINAAYAILDKLSFFGFSCAAIYVAMERARRAEKTTTTTIPLTGEIS